MNDEGTDLRALLETLDPKARDDWADIIDMLTMYPDARRRLVRVLGELEADHRTG